ncbi:EF-hand calcium-binding domain-containing protein 4B-like [Protopterus annectens]|uniref:EF-hand calcium-binding domain-containing protein 4B-like n=1 Tax=Protopterus annectens TaxID=7888 RepID=UPI001CF95799|nr:EF-hand calcium-binding domain-containing protein 4B-like [Protopterus annectens]
MTSRRLTKHIMGKIHGGDGAIASQSKAKTENVQQEMLEKARELFQQCDKEEKGFITKRDMQRLQSELPLTPEQLEDVFDSLDHDGNGYLTPVEFSMGLGKYIGTGMFPSAEGRNMLKHEETFESDDVDLVDSDDEKRFCSMMEQLGASEVFEDQSEVRELWARLRRERPELLNNFEEFLFKVSSHIKEVHYEKETMEQALKRRENDHDNEVRHLYEEMEQQIKKEKDRLLSQDSMRHHDRNHHLQEELRSKEQELENIISRQKKLEKQIQELSYEKTETRVQNERLRCINDELQDQLEHCRQELDQAQYHLHLLQQEAQMEQEEKARNVLRVSKNMQKEKESLLRQLELLRDMNKKLRDERDAYEAKKPTSPGKKKPLLKKGSVIGKYLVDDKPVKRPPSATEEVTSEPIRKSCRYVSFKSPLENESENGCQALGNPTQTGSVAVPQEAQGINLAELKQSTASLEGDGEDLDEMPLSPRGQPIGTEHVETEPLSASPDRIFKVVFVGNSGVGKSSFIHRFCHNRFLAEISATIGIDYRVKSLVVDHTQVALQLWDTAGQERFRSITKQYFRKADAVLVMYDVTAESSFTAVRNWMMSIKEGIEDGAIIVLLGNKTDAAEHESLKVPKAEAERLAKDYKSLFYECSAMSGYNITEPMLHLARLLTEQEDKQREKALHLSRNYDKKKNCCI